MPLYEWECLACEITFEDLAPVSEGRLERVCPSCGRMSPRVVSTFAIASGGPPQAPAAAQAGKAAGSTEPPICLRYPHIPLLCHMDKPTAERAVAYAHGRGAEYDDRKGQSEELRKKRGLPPPPPPAPPAHIHPPNPRRHQAGAAKPDHSHDHSKAGHDHGHGKAADAKSGQSSPAPGPHSH